LKFASGVSLADEYDAVQPADAAVRGRPKSVPEENAFTAKGVGLTRKQIHEGRAVRDAEKNDPGVVRRQYQLSAAFGKTAQLFEIVPRILFPCVFVHRLRFRFYVGLHASDPCPRVGRERHE
jgi:hypothetical protein